MLMQVLIVVYIVHAGDGNAVGCCLEVGSKMDVMVVGGPHMVGGIVGIGKVADIQVDVDFDMVEL